MSKQSSPNGLQISEEDFDALPFGIIRIDRAGRILQYNAFESELSGQSVADVTGRNFFKDIAPCTDVADFHGRLLDTTPDEIVNMQFPFTFPFEHPRRVFIHIVSGPRKSYWIFVSEAATNRTLQALLKRDQDKE